MGTWAMRLAGVAAMLLAVAPALAADPPHHPYGATKSDPVKVRSLAGTPPYRAYLPEVVDLSGSFPTPGDQGEQGSCTAFAVGYAARAYYGVTKESRQAALPQSIPSPAFIYDQNVGDPNDCESGSTNIAALDVLKYHGALSLADYPYDPDSCAVPTQAQLDAGTDFRIEDYRTVDYNDLDRVKGELADGNPVIIRVVPDDAFENLWDNPKGVWHSPPLPEDSFGHAITLVGYNEQKQTFKFINSWGADWSDGGYGRMDYQTFLNRTTEAFVMVMPAGTPPLPVQHEDVPQSQPEIPAIPEEVKPAENVVVPNDWKQNPPQNDVAVDLPQSQPADDNVDDAIVAEVPTAPADPAPRKPVDIARLQCAKVDVVTRGNRKVAEGFVGSPGDLKAVEEALAGQVDDVNVAVAPWPQCEALETLSAQLAERDAPKVTVSSEAPKAGDTLSISVETPDFDSYVHVAYIQADGTVVNLQQVDLDHLQTIGKKSTLKFGDGKQGRAKFEVAAPFGNETLLVISSRSPLFEAPLPATETEREFLSSLRAAILARPDPQSPERFISAAYVPISTSGG